MSGVILILIGSGLIWLSAKQSSQYLRKMGLGLIIGGLALIFLSRLDVELFPGTN